MHEEPPATNGAAARLTGAADHLAAVFVLYALLAVVITWPVAARLGSGVPHDLADPLLNTWLLWWNAHALPFSSEWWSGPFFHPLPGVLSFSENLVGLSPLTTPLQWLGVSALAAYNLVFVLSFALSAFTAHLVARALGLGRGPSLVAGLAFGFAPQRAANLAHLQVLCAFPIPLIFLAAHRFAANGRRGWLWLLALAWVMLGLTNGYFLAYASVLFGAWLAWFLRTMPRRRALELVLAWGLAIASLAPVLSRYSRWQAFYGFERRIQEIESFSADVRGLLAPAPGLASWPSPAGFAPESCLFPGLTVSLLLALLIAGSWRRKPANEGRAALVFAAAAACAGAVAAVTGIVGPWRLSLGVVVLSVKALGKPLSIALYSLLLAVLASRSLREAWRRGSVPAFYLLGAAAMIVLSFGPNPVAGELKVWDKAPYYFLLKLPGLSALRAPTRIAMLGEFCLALTAAMALGRAVERRGARAAALLVTIAAGGVLGDGWLARVPVPPAPAAVVLPADAAGAAVLELPIGEEQDASAMFRATVHRAAVVNGYSGYAPPHYAALWWGLLRREPGVLDGLREPRSLLVLVDPGARDADGLRRLVQSHEGVRSLGEVSGRSAYLLPGREPWSAPPLGPAIPLRLESGSRQRAVFELLRPGSIGGVLLRFGSGVASLPAAVTVETGDRGAWTLCWRGPVAGLALRGALRDPKRVPVLIETPGAAGRLVRLSVDGVWTIEEVLALAPQESVSSAPVS